MSRKKYVGLGRLLLAAGLLLAALQLARTVLAQDEPDYDRINSVAQELNCPTCTGINLADCRTQTCAQWKDQIKDLLAEGYSDQEVLDYFVTQYGTQVLQEPPKSGFTLALWLLPFILIAVGGGLLFFTLRSWRGNQTAAAPAGESQPAPARDDYLSQVERDLGLE